MQKEKKSLRVYPGDHQRVKVNAARAGMDICDYVALLSQIEPAQVVEIVGVEALPHPADAVDVPLMVTVR